MWEGFAAFAEEWGQERTGTTSYMEVFVLAVQLSSTFDFHSQVTHVWPRVTARGAVRFDTIQLGNASHHPVIIDNPSDQPLMIQAYISTIGGPEINAIVGAQHCK